MLVCYRQLSLKKSEGAFAENETPYNGLASLSLRLTGAVSTPAVPPTLAGISPTSLPNLIYMLGHPFMRVSFLSLLCLEHIQHQKFYVRQTDFLFFCFLVDFFYSSSCLWNGILKPESGLKAFFPSIHLSDFPQASMQQQPEQLTWLFTYLISSNCSFYLSGWAFYLPISFKPGLLLDRSPFPCDGWIRTWLLQVDPINQESSHLLTPRHPLNCVKPMPYNPSPFITFFFCWFCAHGFSFPSGDKKGSTIYNPNQFYVGRLGQLIHPSSIIRMKVIDWNKERRFTGWENVIDSC